MGGTLHTHRLKTQQLRLVFMAEPPQLAQLSARSILIDNRLHVRCNETGALSLITPDAHTLPLYLVMYIPCPVCVHKSAQRFHEIRVRRGNASDHQRLAVVVT